MSPISQHIQQRVAEFIRQEHLLEPPHSPLYADDSALQVCVALSGGPDSVALLHILTSIGYRCHALHCNFHLRGEESIRDEKFCRQLCESLCVPLTVKEFDTRTYMQQQHLSLEMAARELRYGWWATLGNTPIALGHHLDDSIETALMNLMRGTGIQGLTGIVPFNQATHTIRPLLCLSRADIIGYLLDNDLSYVEDSTNAHCDTLRNQIRHQLIPLMERLVPQTRTGIALTMNHLFITASWAERMVKEYDFLTQHHRQWGVEWDELSLPHLYQHFAENEIEHYLHEWRHRFCNAATHRVVQTATLVYTQPIGDDVLDRHRPQLNYNISTVVKDPYTKPEDLIAYFDADTLSLPLSLRRWRQGDRMAPLGMGGHSKLVSDLFSNAHYSPMQKATTWLVTDATGAILWVVGLRTSELHKVSDQTLQVISACISASECTS